MGYLAYDSLYSLVFFRHIGSITFLLHHALGFICCGFGLYFHRMAIFGMLIQVSSKTLLPLPFLTISVHIIEYAITWQKAECPLPESKIISAKKTLLSPNIAMNLQALPRLGGRS